MLTLLLAVNTLFGNCATNGDNFAYAPDSLTYEVYLSTISFSADNEVFNFAKQELVNAGVVTESDINDALNYSKIGVAE